MPRRLLALSLSALAVACAGNDVDYRVRYAPGFAPSHHTVSVFGVYKNGQMSAEAWESLAPKLSAWLSGAGAACASGYVDGATAKSNPALWSAVDDYTRSNGPTDDLLGELAPAAQGDLVLVVTVAGRVPEQEKASPQGESPSPSPSMSGGMGGMQGGGGAAMPMRHDKMMPAGSKDALDLAALLYSPAEKKSVAEVSLEYTGHSLDDALSKFAAKLNETVPGATCASWSWDGKVDVDKVKKLGGE